MKIFLLFENTMVKILTFFFIFVLLSYSLTSTLLFFPLDLVKSLNSIFGYGTLIVAVTVVTWLMGD